MQAGGRGFESRRLHQPNKINALRDFAPLEGPEKAGDHPQNGFQAVLEAFLLSRRVGNCSLRTIGGYTEALHRFARTLGHHDLDDVTSLDIQRYLTGLSETMKPASVHHYYRPLKTFFRWCVETGLLSDNPVRGIIVRVPRSLPRVPEDEDVRSGVPSNIRGAQKPGPHCTPGGFRPANLRGAAPAYRECELLDSKAGGPWRQRWQGRRGILRRRGCPDAQSLARGSS